MNHRSLNLHRQQALFASGLLAMPHPLNKLVQVPPSKIGSTLNPGLFNLHVLKSTMCLWSARHASFSQQVEACFSQSRSYARKQQQEVDGGRGTAPRLP